MTNLLIILGVLLVALVLVVPLLEKTAQPVTEENMQKYHKVFRFLMGVMLLALVIRYFMGK